ncbi:MAG: four helix bundle protein [Bacteroidota bacterium]
MNSFEELECWKVAAELRKEVSKLTKTFPAEEKFRLTDQMKRCSRSVTNNIAEGYGRFHYQENIQFCRHSRGSLNELIDHFIIAYEEEYIDEIKLNTYKEDINKNLRILNGYINYLRKQKENAKHSDN